MMCENVIIVHKHSCYVHLFNQSWLASDGKELRDVRADVSIQRIAPNTITLNGTFTADDLMALAVALSDNHKPRT